MRAVSFAAHLKVPLFRGIARSRGARLEARVTAFAALLSLTWAVVGFAQPDAGANPAGFFARSWFVEDGLPHNVVNRAVQDGRGFLWVATAGGLARFDGREFREFAVPMANPDAGFNIRDLTLENPDTLLLLPASGGVLRLRDGVFTDHPVTAALTGKTVLNIFSEPGGTLWLGGPGTLLMRWHDGKLATLGAGEGFLAKRAARHYFAIDGDGRTWVSCGDFLGWYRDGRLIQVPLETRASIGIAAARSGGVWISTDERLLKWEDDRLSVVCDQLSWLPGKGVVQHLFEDRSGVLWIATRRLGLFRLQQGKPVSVPTGRFQITALTADAESNLWAAMEGGGLSRLKPKTFVVLDSSTGMPDDQAVSVCEDASGAIWCADRRNGLVCISGGETRIFSQTDTPLALYASNVCPDQQGNLWIGSVNGLYRLPADRSQPVQMFDRGLQPVRSLFCGRDGDVWVGSGSGAGPGYQLGRFHAGVYRAFSAAEGFQGKHVVAIADAADGAVWIGTYDGEVLELRDGRFIPRIGKREAQLGHIHSLHFDASGALWLGSERGLARLKDGRLRVFTRADGLPDDLITQVLEDDRGRLWVSSRRGFFYVGIDGLNAVAEGRTPRVAATMLGREEGLPAFSSPVGGQPMAWKGHDGRLWFVTDRGVIGFDPEGSLPTRAAPAVYIDSILVEGRSVPVPAESLRIPSGDHRVDFRFVAPNYSAPEKVRLRHRLVGFDQDWIETTAARSASYVRLPPGTYQLRVMATSGDGGTDNFAANLGVIVVPAWWQTWWLRALFVLGFTGLVAALARLWSHRRLKSRLDRLEREHALEKERSRIARDLHDDLGGSLTQIGLLADRLKRQGTDPALGPALGQLAWRTRRLAGDLESIVWTVSPKNNTLDRLAAFIAQYVNGFCRDTAVRVIVRGEESIPPVPVAPDAQHHLLAVLKEALNNVLKHAHATGVTVTMAVEGEEFVLRVADDGIGFDPAAAEHSERNGLNNIRSRVADLGGRVEISSGAGRGTEIVLRQRLPAGVRPVPGKPAALA